MTPATGTRDRSGGGCTRRTLVIFLVLAALLPGLIAAMATGVASLYGECRGQSHPDSLVCNAG